MKYFAAFFVLVSLALPAPASAQSVEPATSQIHVVVFGPPRGLPVAGATVEVRGGDAAPTTLQTNRDGAAWLNVAPGNYSLRITDKSLPDAQVADVEVARGEGAEVVVEVRADGKVVADVETVELGKGRQQAQANTTEQTGPPGTLAGTVVAYDDGEPVRGARVFVRGLSNEAKTGPDGHFTMSVPAGTWDVSVIHSEYSTASKTDITIEADKTTDVRIEMTPASVRLDTFTVTIPRIEGGTIALLDERKETSQVADVIGAEQFSKSGDSTAAAALGRVTGLTVVDGKYVYVRGLGERYSSSLLNGSMLPSPNPERRVVPLDLFPTSILESVVVQKTYSADMPGGFGGGVIRMRTRSFPSEFAAGVDVSVGANPMYTFDQAQRSRGGSYDWLGIDDGTRALPDRVRRAAADSPLKERGTFSSNGYSPTELEAIGEALPNNYATHSGNVMPDLGVSANIGDTIDLFDIETGYRLALSYDNRHDVERWHEVFYNSDTLRESQANIYDFDKRVDGVTVSGMLAGGMKFDENNKIELVSLLTRLSDNATKVYQGYYADYGDDIRITDIAWLERQLMFHQLRGEHVFPGLHDSKLQWRYGFGQARRNEPDHRTYRYDWVEEIDDWAMSWRPDGNTRLYSELVDNSHDLGASWTLPFDVWSSLEAKLKFGADFLYKTRAVSTRRFSFKAEPPPPAEERAKPPEEVFSNENIGPDGYEILETTRPTDNYGATHTIVAPYVLGHLPLTRALEAAAGVRLEQSTQTVTTTQLFTGEEASTTLDTLDVLPSLSLTWKFAEDMQLRGAVARTVNRPDFRELSPACYDTVVGGNQQCGNPDLDRATIIHYDTRWEWYPSRGESVSVGAFLKDFNDPIELVIQPGSPPQQSFQNVTGATNYGVEFDARKKLDFVSDAMRDFYVAGNVALIWSQIRIDPNDDSINVTNHERPLQGQSPYVLNMQFGYDNADTGTAATMLYNVFGRRISGVGSYEQPDTYEEPVHVVDFTFSQRLSEHFKLGFKAQNLLDTNRPSSVASKNTVRQYRGRSFSAKVAWEY